MVVGKGAKGAIVSSGLSCKLAKQDRCAHYASDAARGQEGAMKTPATPDDESERLTKLEQLGIVDSAAEERFDRITRLARLQWLT